MEYSCPGSSSVKCLISFSIVAFHLAGLGSIPSWLIFFLVEIFSGLFLNRKTNVRKLRPYPSPDIIVQLNHKNHSLRAPMTSCHHHQSVLPKGRSLTADSETKAAVLLKGRSFTVDPGTKVEVLLGINRCGRFPLLSTTHSLFSI